MSWTKEIADVDQLKKTFDGLDTSVNKNVDDLMKLIKVYEDLSKAMQSSAVTAENLGKAQKAVSNAAKQKETIDKQIITTTEKLTAAENGSIKPLLEKKIALQAATKALTDEIKAEGLAETSLVRMRQKLKELTEQYDKAGVRTKASAKEINDLSIEIGKAEEATNRFGRGVGGYRNQLGDLSKGLMNGTTSVGEFKSGIISMGKAAMAWLLTPVGMIVAAIGGLVMAGKALINNAQDFERAGSSLSAITGAVGKDLDFMKKKAREFAKDSESSATEILVAFEKVGSKLPELLKNGPLLAEVSRNALILSESTQGKLKVEDAAVAAAAALNAFGIPLTDSMRAINTLAAASLAGGAEVMDLVDSFKNLAPVAVSANMSLEQSAAALEVLEKFQLKAEKGGMQLKGSLLQLQAAGLGFASGQFNINDALLDAKKRLEDIADPIARAAEQEKIFGRENMTAGLIMMNNRQQFIDLTATIEEQVKKGTIAQDMAKTATDNLQGSYSKLGNAWKGLLLQLEDGGGVVMSIWRGIVDATTFILNDIQITFEKIGKFFDKFRSEQSLKDRDDKKAAKDKAEADKQAADKAIKLAADKEAMDAGIRQRKAEADKKNAEATRKIAEKKAADEQKAVDAFVKGMNDQMDAEAKFMASQDKARADEVKAQDDLYKQLQEGNDDYLDKFIDQKDKETEATKKAIDKQKELEEDLKQAKIDMAIEAANAVFEFRDMALQKELNALQVEKDAKLSNTKLTTEQRAAMEADYEKKSNAIKAKQAKNEKLQALFNIAINTAVASMKTLASTPLPAGLPLLIFTIAMGAVQAALVAAQPIPKYKDGTKSAESRGIFGEAGLEVMFPVGGGAIFADKPTYFDGDKFKGAQIYSNPETKKMMSLVGDRNIIVKNQNDPQLLDQMKRIEKAIVSKPVAIYDQDHRQIGQGNSNYQTIYLNRLTRSN